MRPRPLLRGLLSFVPGFDAIAGTRGCAEGTLSPRYCYSVWLRHLMMAHAGGLDTAPQTVAELGPGASIGMGLAALLSGSQRYWALDVVRYANAKRNLEIFDELVELFARRASIPNDTDLIDIQPSLDSYEFPLNVLTDTRLAAALAPDRLARLRNVIGTLGSPSLNDQDILSYMVPWQDRSAMRPDSVDAIFSQAVLEHVNDLSGTYEAMHTWLRPGGFMSHQVDFRSHATTKTWNGHWGVSDLTWAIAKGGREYFLNREPCSRHLSIVSDLGFKVVHQQLQRGGTGIERRDLAPRFRDMPDGDLNTCGLFLQAVKA